MTTEYTIKENIQKLEEVPSHEEKLHNILNVYMELFPSKIVGLYRYSPLGYLGEGIHCLTSSKYINIREIREDIRSLPIISSAIHEKKAKFCFGIEFLKEMSSRFIVPSKVNSMVVVPICLRNSVIGYILSFDYVENEIHFDEKMLSLLTLYGSLVGKLIGKSDFTVDSKILSKRELEVMKRISLGESTKEMANKMGISELTVIQYVKTALKKLGAHNRSHAVGELFRKGIIT
ncbi:helix-turn-helix transcriptional regulator [Neobacillus drentensis]|uniref:response regulator transcription factor n=1 Tax=Neobacillus drentensis TaxID=220684 RepID=UPI002FFF33D0